MSECTARMFSGRVAVTRLPLWKLAHAHLLHSQQESSLLRRTVLYIAYRTNILRTNSKTSKFYGMVKVKCTLVQALRLCTGRTAHRGSRGIALLFHDQGIRRGWGVSVTPRLLFTTGKDSVNIVQEAGWAPGPIHPSIHLSILPSIKKLVF